MVRLCDALEIEKPIVLGIFLGGFVAQRYLGRHPDHPAKVVLSSTVPRWDLEAVLAMFRSLGGDEAYDVARAFWSGPTKENSATYLAVCGPLYTQTPGNMFEAVETIRTPDVMVHWHNGEHQSFDLRPDLAAARGVPCSCWAVSTIRCARSWRQWRSCCACRPNWFSSKGSSTAGTACSVTSRTGR